MIRKDLDLNFIKNPITGDLNTKMGIDAIKQSLKTLLLTSLYEKPFNNKLGGNLNAFLFANYVIGLDQKIKERIATIIAKYEPSVEILNLSVSGFDRGDNQMKIYLEYLYSGNIRNNLSLIVERSR